VRWKLFIPISLLMAAVVVFGMVFLDPLTEQAIEKLGSKIVGAKVDVQSVDVGILKTHMVIRGLAVASKDDEWKNIFEADRLAFDYAFVPLLSKKLVIEEMAVTGMKWGTPRKISGALPKRRRKKSKEPSIFKKLAKKVELPKVDLKGIKNIDWKKKVDPKNLESVTYLEDQKAKATELRQQWDKRIEDLKIKETIDQAKSRLKEAKSLKIKGPQDIPKAKTTITNLRESQKALKAKVSEINSLKASLKSDLKQTQGFLKAVEKIKERDMQKIMNTLKLPDLSTKGIAKSIFGPLWLDRVEKTMYWVAMARKYMPSKKDKEEKAKKTPPRRKGVNVSFPLKRTYPKFLIEEIVVSGSTQKGTDGKKAIDFSGKITGITSDPPTYGKPATIAIEGTRQGTALTVSVIGKLDHTKETARDEFVFNVQGSDLKGKSWKLPEFLPSTVNRGRGSARFGVVVVGEKFDVSLQAKGEGLKLEGAKKANNTIERIIQKAFYTIDVITAKATAHGTGDDISFGISTNLDNIIAGQLKSLVGDEVNKVRQGINSHINSLLADKKKDVQQLFKKQQKELLAKLSQKSGPLTSQLNQSSSLIKGLQSDIKKNVGAGLQKILPKDFKNIFK